MVEIYNAGLQGLSIGQATGPVITSFTANPANVPAGGTTTLSWTVQNAATADAEWRTVLQSRCHRTDSHRHSRARLRTRRSRSPPSNPQGSTNAQRLVGVGPPFRSLSSMNSSPPMIPGCAMRPSPAIVRTGSKSTIPNTLYSLDLGGYHLTDEPDNLDKWTFPSVILPPGGYLIVFASEKNRAVAGAPLHTNFKLSGERRVSRPREAGRRDYRARVRADLSQPDLRCQLQRRRLSGDAHSRRRQFRARRTGHQRRDRKSAATHGCG